jgi:hypothetical protein
MYYRLEGNSTIMTTYTNAIRKTHKSLIDGKILTIDENKLPFIFEYSDETENAIPDFFQGDNIMSKRMYSIFSECGVDNIQQFPMEFIDKITAKKRDDYIVFNILGMISCAKVEKSDKLPLGGGYYFRNLVIDPLKTHGLSVFRLKESLMDIIVIDKIAKKLEDNNINGIILTPLDN